MANEQQLPRLIILDLYRNALRTVERLSRQKRDKRLHAWAVKSIDEVADVMVQLANDEMYGEVSESEEDKKKIEEEGWIL